MKNLLMIATIFSVVFLSSCSKDDEPLEEVIEEVCDQKLQEYFELSTNLSESEISCEDATAMVNMIKEMKECDNFLEIIASGGVSYDTYLASFEFLESMSCN